MNEALRIGVRDTDADIKAEVERFYEIARESLSAIWPAVKAVARALLEREELDRDGFDEVVGGLGIIGSPVDFVGIDVYRPANYVLASDDETQARWHEVPFAKAHPKMDDEPAPDGKVYDTDRVMFLRSYLTQLQRATAEGVPVKGYFQWSTMDNFEWTAGLSGNRYGLVYVDFQTQKRTAKLSAEWFRETAQRNRVA